MRALLIPSRTRQTAFVVAIAALAPGAARGGPAYTFQSLSVPPGTGLTQVRDAGIGLAVGYIGNQATAWRLDGSGERINLHRIPPNQPAGVNLIFSEADGVDDIGQIVGYADRLTLVNNSNAEGAYWANTGAYPSPLATRVSPYLEYSTIFDIDGRWAVGEGHRLSGPNAIGDRAFVWDVNTGARRELLGPGGTGKTAVAEITGRTAVGHRS